MGAYERSFGAERRGITHTVPASLPAHTPPGETRDEAGETRHLREIPARAAGAADQKVLGETPEAVKPA